MSAYREETTFTIQLQLTASFDESYEGDDDGWAWLEEFRRTVQPRAVQALFTALRSQPGWRVVPVSRGHHPDDVLEIRIERIVP
jgi:hypothetical protein